MNKAITSTNKLACNVKISDQVFKYLGAQPLHYERLYLALKETDKMSSEMALTFWIPPAMNESSCCFTFLQAIDIFLFNSLVSCSSSFFSWN